MEDLIKKILNNKNIIYNQITKATSGFTNLVYFVDDKFVIKVSKDEETKTKIEKEISIYKNITLDFIPKYISSGEIDNYEYLIISKVKGNSLYTIWHTLTNEQRQDCIKQIAEILKQFNNQNIEFLDKKYIDLNWVECITNKLNEKSKALADMGYNTKDIDKFIFQKLPTLFAQNTFGLVYNDAHFDNFIYDSGRLSLIDFDRVRVCPIDYEMLIFKCMCDNPSKFASEEDEEKIKDEDYAGIYELFKVQYPQMFTHEKIETRIAVYQFNYLIGQAINIKNHGWINELLQNFQSIVQG